MPRKKVNAPEKSGGKCRFNDSPHAMRRLHARRTSEPGEEKIPLALREKTRGTGVRGGTARQRCVTLGHRGGRSRHFASFVTFACAQRRDPGRRERTIALLQGIGGLAAHPRGARREGDRPACSEGDNEGDGLVGRPFARPARAAGTGEKVQALSCGCGDRRRTQPQDRRCRKGLFRRRAAARG